MASRAVRHALTVVGLAHGVADSVENSYNSNPPKTIRRYLEKIRERCRECFQLWPDQLTQKEIVRINRRMSILEGTVTTEEGRGDVVALISLVLALLDDLRNAVSVGKRPAIDGLIASYRRISHYYDRRLDKWHCYDAAVSAVRQLEQIEA